MRNTTISQDEYTQSVAEIKSSFSWLKEMAILDRALRRYQAIALVMGLEPVRLLSPGDIAKMTLTEAAQEFDQSDLNSFRDCDLIIAAQSPSDGDCYIAVQVSYTVDPLRHQPSNQARGDGYTIHRQARPSRRQRRRDCRCDRATPFD